MREAVHSDYSEPNWVGYTKPLWKNIVLVFVQCDAFFASLILDLPAHWSMTEKEGKAGLSTECETCDEQEKQTCAI